MLNIMHLDIINIYLFVISTVINIIYIGILYGILEIDREWKDIRKVITFS